MAINQ
ncbi:hypothetical protein YPPY90_3951, partial [Yersinia pestis PY-90]